jgi:hypothetical protein
MQNKYRIDYANEKKLNNDRLDRLKDRVFKKYPKRNNNSQNYREMDTRRRLVVLTRNEAENNSRSPVTSHPLGSVPISSRIY